MPYPINNALAGTKLPVPYAGTRSAVAVDVVEIVSPAARGPRHQAHDARLLIAKGSGSENAGPGSHDGSSWRRMSVHDSSAFVAQRIWQQSATDGRDGDAAGARHREAAVAAYERMRDARIEWLPAASAVNLVV